MVELGHTSASPLSRNDTSAGDVHTFLNHRKSKSSWEDKKQETSAANDIREHECSLSAAGSNSGVRTREARITSGVCKELIATRGLLFSKKFPPEVSGISFGDPEIVPLEVPAGEDGFDFSQHVTEDQRELGQVPSAERRTERQQ